VSTPASRLAAPADSASALWHGFLDTLSDPLWVLDADARVSFANTAALRLLPCEPGAPVALLVPHLPAALAEWIEEALAGRADPAVPPVAGALLSRLNAQRWALRLPPAAGRREAAPAANHAVPVPAARVLSLAELPIGYAASPFPVVLQDAAFRLVDVNDAFVDYLGRPRARLIGADPLAFVPVEDQSDWLANRERWTRGEAEPEAARRIERRVLDAQGRERWFRAARHEVRGHDGERLTVTQMQDCTAEHAARERAERSMSELEQWFGLSPVGMLAFDGSGLVLRSNVVFEALVGRAPVLLNEAPPALRALLGWSGPGSLDGLVAGGDAAERRGWIDAPPGAPAPGVRRLRARVRCLMAGGGGEPRYIAVIEDLSAEQALNVAQAQLGAVVEAAGVGVALASVGRDLVLPESLPEFERLQRAVRDGERAQGRYAIRHPERGVRWLLTRVEPPPGGEGAPSAVTLDVTEQERSLARSEQLLRELTSILESSTAGIAYLRGDTLVRCNRRFERMLGFSAGAVAGCSVRELFTGQPNAAQLIAETEQALGDGGLYETEVELRSPERAPLWVALSARRIGPAGPTAEVVAVLSDITRLKRQQAELESLAQDRERTEAAMAEQAELTRAILDSVFVGIVTVGPEGIEWMNRSARRMFGGDLADFFHQPLERVATGDPQHPFRRAAEQLRAGAVAGEVPDASFECCVQALDGRSFWVVGNAVATGNAVRTQLTYALLDIDRRRQAEERTEQAQASLQRVLDLAPLAIVLFDAASGRVRQANPVAAALAGGAREALLGRLPAELPWPVDAQAIEADLGAALAGGGGVTRRDLCFSHQGRERVWDARYLPLARPGEPPDEVLLVATDVTEQRIAEAARLEAAIAQRDMLVKEVHHRIKNNLQGVAGLLTQIGQRQPAVAPALHEAVGQVQAIAQVYGLQVTGTPGPLPLAGLVEAIAAGLRRSSGREIAVVRHGEAGAGPADWALPEPEAIPVALTLNELIGNALKHGRGGPVECAITSAADQVRLEIRNDGRLPADFRLEQIGAGVAGLGLVRALLPRRSSTLALDNDGADRVLASVSLRPPSLVRLAT